MTSHLPNIVASPKLQLSGRPSLTRAAVSVLITFLLTSSLCAADNTSSASVYPQAPGIMYLLKLALTLAVVLGAFILLAKIMRRLNGSGATSGGPLKIVAGLTLGNRERLLVVKAGETQLLLGVSAAGIEKLHQFEDDADLQKYTQNNPASPLKDRFQHVLNGLQK